MKRIPPDFNHYRLMPDPPWWVIGLTAFCALLCLALMYSLLVMI